MALEALNTSFFKGLKPPDKLVWLCLIILGEGQHSVRNIASILGISNETARQALETLLEHNLVVITQRGSGTRPHCLQAVLPDTENLHAG